MLKLPIPEHMHNSVLKSKDWIWGDDLYFYGTVEFVVDEEGKFITVYKLTDSTKEKRDVIESLGLDFFNVDTNYEVSTRYETDCN